jgi:hypothetical protein
MRILVHMTSHTPTRRQDISSLVVALSSAASRYVTGSSVELARNVAQACYCLDDSGWTVDVNEAATVAYGAIQHRVAHQWVTCEDRTACAHAMAVAWEAWQRPNKQTDDSPIDAVLSAGGTLVVKRSGHGAWFTTLSTEAGHLSGHGASPRAALSGLAEELRRES